MGVSRLMQLALDLWDSPSAEASAPASPTGPFVPGALLDDVMPVAVHQHPRTTRWARLNGCDVGFELVRGKRRTIGLSITADGLSVRAPRWTPVAEVDAVLQQKAQWVLDKLQETQARTQALAQARVQWADGACFDYLGQRVRMVIDPTQSQPCHLDTEAMGGACLCLGLSHQASEAQIRDTVQAWLMRQAQQVFEARLTHFAPRLGVTYSRLRLSSAGKRWGSATADGTIRLNWRLIHMNLDMVDYVVVHELSHLRHMDHSPQFWEVVASILPDHIERRRALNAAVPMAA
jgi:predicted metal-dependent hydrolase